MVGHELMFASPRDWKNNNAVVYVIGKISVFINMKK